MTANLFRTLASPTAIALTTLLLLPACTAPTKGPVVNHSKQDYGPLPDGQTASLYTLTNANGLTATLTDFGATLVSLQTPDREGKFADITLGYDRLDGWVKDSSYMGATVGRYGNRIAGGAFTLEGERFTLATNNGPNHLHGGNVGFNKKRWLAEVLTEQDAVGVRFIYISPDGEEGYPGTLTSTATYLLNNNDELTITFTATTDMPTVVNLVHHTYWNLTGDPSQTILDHRLLLQADRYVPTDQTGIPHNSIQPVEGTPMDFRTATAIGERIDADFEQLRHGKGYDHCWHIDGEPGILRLAAVAYEPESGRLMQVETDQPGIQLYTGNYLDGSSIGKNNIPHGYRTGFCLETQAHPDSPNQPGLGNVVLMPGQTYRHTMVHRFRTK